MNTDAGFAYFVYDNGIFFDFIRLDEKLLQPICNQLFIDASLTSSGWVGRGP